MRFTKALSFFLPKWASELHSGRSQPTLHFNLSSSEVLINNLEVDHSKSKSESKVPINNYAYDNYHNIENQINTSMEAIQNAQWISETFASFSSALQKISDDENLFIRDSLRLLSKSISAKYSGYFEIEEGENAVKDFRSRASIGYDFSFLNNVQTQLSYGYLLQSSKDLECILIHDIPDDYLKISSGLGECTPNCLLLCPVHLEKECFGVFEFAFLGKVKTREIEFVKKCAEAMAFVFNRRRTFANTKALLETSQEQAEQLTLSRGKLENQMLEIQKNKEALDGLVNSLRDKEDQLYRIINGTEDIIFTYNDNLDVTLFNRAFEKMLGQNNRRAKFAYHASHLSFALNHDLKEYLAHAFKGEEFATQIEVNQLHFLLNVFPISKDHELIVEGGAYLKNITHSVEKVKRDEEVIKQKELESTLQKTKATLAKLEEEQNKNLAIIDSYVDAFLCFNEKGVIEYVNTAFTKMTGHSREELILAKVEDILPVYFEPGIGEVRLKSKDEISTVISEKTEIMITIKDGTNCTVLASATLINLSKSKLVTLIMQKISVDLF